MLGDWGDWGETCPEGTTSPSVLSALLGCPVKLNPSITGSVAARCDVGGVSTSKLLETKLFATGDGIGDFEKADFVVILRPLRPLELFEL